MSLQKFSAALAMIVMLVMMGTVSNADEFHYNNMLIGDRATGMGGAYAGVSDDPSGLYYNPAGIVYTTGRNLASLGSYFDRTKKYDSVIDLVGREGHIACRTSSYHQPLGGFGFGFSYAVTDSIRTRPDPPKFSDKPGSGNEHQFNNEDDLPARPSLAMGLNSKIAAGMTSSFYHPPCPFDSLFCCRTAPPFCGRIAT
jgi:long-chain fatty acid transport protein